MNRKVQGVRNFVDDHMIGRLEDRELAVDYLNAAMEDGDPDVLLVALRDVVKAQGGFTIWSVVDALTRLARESRYVGNRTVADQKAASLLTMVG